MEQETSDHDPQPRRSHTPVLLASILLAATGLSCDGKQYEDHLDEVVEVPETYYREVEVDAQEEAGWCASLRQSDGLEAVLNRALNENMSLASAWARMRQAEAQAQAANATLFPSLSLSAEASQRQQLLFLPSGGLGGGPPGMGGGGDGGGDGDTQQVVLDVTQYSSSLGASYEIDMWGRLAAQRRGARRGRAARRDAEATRADAEAMAITVMAQTTERWFDLVYEQQRVELIEEQIQASQESLNLLEARFGQGLTTALDLEQQRQQVESLRGQLAQAKAAREVARAQLAPLLGTTPKGVELPELDEDLPAVSRLPNAGVPADLLEQRPDVRAAYVRLAAADERTAAAARERLPTLRLNGSLFYRTQNLDTFFDELLYSVSGAIDQPIFQGGRLNAQLRQSEARGEQLLYDYALALLQAVRDVEVALLQGDGQRDFLTSLEVQLTSAEESEGLALNRYIAGEVTFLRVLTATQTVNQVEQSVLQARRQQVATRVQLCRALGGDWARQLEAPAPLAQDDE